MMHQFRLQFQLSILLGVLMTTFDTDAQPNGFNYDEAKVPAYTLPDPLTMTDGTKVATADMWIKQRRPEILALFETYVYGKTPSKKIEFMYEVETDMNALDGKAVRKQVSMYPGQKDPAKKMSLLIYYPKNRELKVPVFVGLNFQGNHTIASDPGIELNQRAIEFFKNTRNQSIEDPEQTRGSQSSRWAIDTIVDAGYGVATMFYGDIDPDYDDGFQNGIHPLFYREGQTKPKEDEWGSIGAWAWGLSRILDYFETDPEIDETRVIVMGHSRLGKTSLWAGAQDERFAIVISNDSGCGGAALSRRRFGETVARINTSFPHWFCDNFTKFNDKEEDLPVDQHMLLALIAPRPLYVASAEEDLWADPKGEFLSAKHASPVYRLLGKDGLPVEEMPAVNQPVHGTIGYHIRSGKHDVTDYDWEQYIQFANKHLKRQ